MEFNGMDEAESYLQMTFSPRNAGTLHWYVVGSTAAGRLYAANGLRESLEKLLKSAKESGEIADFLTEMIDIKNSPDPMEFMQPVWKKVMHHHYAPADAPKEVYVPFFLNADLHTNLGQTLFDANAPGVLCVSKKGYRSTTNPSKRECFKALFLD